MATKLTKKQQTQLTEKLAGIIRENNALQLRLSADRSVNEMNVNQISGALNRIHGQAIGKELPTEINIPVKQLGSGDPSPDNIRPIVGYEIDGIGTVYGGELNIETGTLTITYMSIDMGIINWATSLLVDFGFFGRASGLVYPFGRAITPFCERYTFAGMGVTNNYYGADMQYKLTYRYTNSSLCEIDLRDSRFDDLESFVSSVSGLLLILESITPETYTLTPQQMIQLLDQL